MLKVTKLRSDYLNGKSIFIVSLLVIVLTTTTVYISGIGSSRELYKNWYFTVSIISFVLFLFMGYLLYYGIDLNDNYSENKGSVIENIHIDAELPDLPEIPDIGGGEDFVGIIIAILLWIVLSIFLIYALVFLGMFLWYFVAIILSLLYWLFFRALKFVSTKSQETKGDLRLSLVYSLGYTFLYAGWIFALIFLSQQFG